MALVPQINSYGVYTLLAPFTIDGHNYRCSSIQLLQVLDSNDVDIFNQVYVPKGLSSEIYSRDVNGNVSIITLVSNTDTVTVPSSYIDSIPAELAVPYSKNIISLTIDMLPDSEDLTNLIEQLVAITQSQIGDRPVAKTHRIPGKLSVSVAESAFMEAERELRKGDVLNYYNAVQKLQAENTALHASIAALEQLLINIPQP